jgi:hypothetical protein
VQAAREVHDQGTFTYLDGIIAGGELNALMKA